MEVGAAQEVVESHLRHVAVVAIIIVIPDRAQIVIIIILVINNNKQMKIIEVLGEEEVEVGHVHHHIIRVMAVHQQ